MGGRFHVEGQSLRLDRSSLPTPLMQSVQTIGIDLPLKALVWQDASGITWLSYNDPSWLAKRHGAGHDVEGTVTALTGALHALAKAATGAQ